MISSPTLRLSGLITDMTWLVRLLAAAVAARGVGRDALPARVVAPTYAWLGRMLRRFAGLVARFEAGRLGVGRLSRRRAVAAGDTPVVAAVPSLFHLRLPRGQGWLLKLMPGQVGHAHQNLARLLSEPELQALIAAAPAVGRLLRPFCRMLGVPLTPELLEPCGERAPVVRVADGLRVARVAAPGAVPVAARSGVEVVSGLLVLPLLRA